MIWQAAKGVDSLGQGTFMLESILTEQRHDESVHEEGAIPLQLKADVHIPSDRLQQAFGGITHASGVLNLLYFHFPKCPAGGSVDVIVGPQRLT